MEEILTPPVVVALIGFLKAFVVAMFGLNLGVILTWVERRMRGMIQDSIGPNRAAIPVPGVVAAGLAAGPAFLIAAGVLFAAFVSPLKDATEEHAFYGGLFTHAGLFIFWLSTAAIARSAQQLGAKNELEKFLADLGSPRTIATVGALLHPTLIGLCFLLSGTEYEAARDQALFFGGALLLAAAAVASSGHMAAGMAAQKSVRLTLLGLLHPAADGVKVAFKADFAPPKSDSLLFNLAPWIAFFPSLVVLAIVPFGPALCFGHDPKGAIAFDKFQGIEATGHACEAARLSLQVADLNVGILYFFAMAGTGIIGAALAGWASDNKFSLLGGMRAASQMVSYEVTMGLTIVGLLMIYGTVRVDEMILWQAENSWGVFVQPFAFFLFVAAAIAETKRVPFDIPEGESEIVAGYYLEYAGMKFSMFFFAEFISVVSSSTIIVALFLGGWHQPFMTAEGILVKIGETELFRQEIAPATLAIMTGLGFVLKIVGMCLLNVIVRWTLPRFRYDQLMSLGWRKLLPASLLNVMLTAVAVIAYDTAGAGVKEVFALLGQASMALLTVAGLAAALAFIIFLFTPRAKQTLVVTSAARYARSMGGTREAQMEA
jgi:NADH-quinone oxidoreductase subunit H